MKNISAEKLRYMCWFLSTYIKTARKQAILQA